MMRLLLQRLGMMGTTRIWTGLRSCRLIIVGMGLKGILSRDEKCDMGSQKIYTNERALLWLMKEHRGTAALYR
jgi:hypothetical protein